MTGSSRSSTTRGFSLPEVLMAIFILGIGVISIAALFPAGILQQRQAVDDTMGPLVAENALALIRSRIGQDDFGTFEQFNQTPPRPNLLGGSIVQGDWPWLRPSFVFPNNRYALGAIDIFGASGSAAATEALAGRSPLLRSIPHNANKYGTGTQLAPVITISQEERYYPQTWIDPGVDFADQVPGKPQYLWDCMFRRDQGRVLVAIFVYRVNVAGSPSLYRQVPNGSIPPLPFAISLDSANVAGGWDAWGIDNTLGTQDDAWVLGTAPCAAYTAQDPLQSWQEDGQWILDQNNNVHRVLSSFCDAGNDPKTIELVRPVPAVPANNDGPLVPAFILSPGAGGLPGVTNVVSDIWYIPRSVFDADGLEYRLTPVFLTVKVL